MDYGGPPKDQSWINVRPGLAIQIEYGVIEYELARGDEAVTAKLTGKVRITRDQIFAADYLTDPITGEEEP